MLDTGTRSSETDAIPAANGWFQIAVASDGATASIKKIVRHSGTGKPVIVMDILKKLKELKVVYGVDREAIDELLNAVENHNVPDKPVVIAKGDVEHGENSHVEWYINGINESETKILVVPKTPVCVKKLSSQGKKGKNVFGKQTNPRPGIDQPLNCGVGISYHKESDTNLIYTATHSGVLTFKSGTLSVDSGLAVSDDKLQAYVDIHVGKVIGAERHIMPEDILETLAVAGIKEGIKTDRIQQVFADKQLTNDEIRNVLIAEGIAPIKGSDEVLKWEVDIAAEEVNPRAVIPEQTIATISTTITPTSGVDVYGEELSAEKGECILVNCGHGVTQIENDGVREYKATCLGVVEFEQDTISIKSDVKISSDKMQVTMSLLRPLLDDDMANILFFHVMQTLEQHEIVYGIKKEAIKLILDNINKNKESKINLLVATGKPVVDGVNARVEYDKEMFNEGKLLDNGSIDFHEKSYPWNVKVDEVIGKLIRGQCSEDGINVFGQEILAKVVEASEPILEGVVLELDGSLRVTEPGVLLVNDINFKVSDNLQIDGDVNQKTGNIHCDKTVNVKGYVEPGFSLETKGDAIIQENVEDALVYAEGNIVIKSGIRGTRSKITCDGDLSAAFAENAELNAKGDIHIKNSIINCHSVCNGVMRIGEPHSKKSGVSGNITHAYQGIESSIIGSDSFNQTIIIAGVGIETTKQLIELNDELNKAKVVLDDLERVHLHYCKNPKSQEEQNALLQKLEETRELKIQERDELTNENERLKVLVDKSKDAKIIVHKRIYPGVKIILSGKTYEVKEERGAGIFRLQGEKVIFEPI